MAGRTVFLTSIFWYGPYKNLSSSRAWHRAGLRSAAGGRDRPAPPRSKLAWGCTGEGYSCASFSIPELGAQQESCCPLPTAPVGSYPFCLCLEIAPCLVTSQLFQLTGSSVPQQPHTSFAGLMTGCFIRQTDRWHGEGFFWKTGLTLCTGEALSG